MFVEEEGICGGGGGGSDEVCRPVGSAVRTLQDREHDSLAAGGLDALHGDLVDALQEVRLEDFRGGPGGGELTFVQKKKPVGEGACEVEVVAGQEDGEVLFSCERAEELGEVELVPEVEER